MNKNSYTKNFIFSSFIFFTGISPAFTDDSSFCPNISNGMTYNEVLTQCGKPLEKIEYEVKHEDLWVYKYYSLRFQEGKLILEKTIQKDSSKQKIENILPKEEQQDTHEWGAIEPINDNVSFEEIINSGNTSEKPNKPSPKLPPPFRRR